MADELLNLSCSELRDKIASGKVKSIEAAEAVFSAIDKYEPVVGAYISTFREQAREQAKAVDEKIAAGKPVGILAGVPVAIKDNMCTTFGATTCASKILG
ncbi:MAG: amidase family protein, partial [Phycisphaerae bacterium]